MVIFYTSLMQSVELKSKKTVSYYSFYRTIDGEIRIGIFATRDIKKGEELTYDYQYALLHFLSQPE